MIAVPRDAVLPVVDDCAERGAKALVVITAGFAEVSAEGRELQQRLVERSGDTACAWSALTALGYSIPIRRCN